MERGDLYLRIGPTKRESVSCPLLFRWMDDSGEWQEEVRTVEFGGAVTEVPDAVQLHLEQRHPVPPALRNLLLDVRDPIFYTKYWEQLLRHPPLPQWVVTRFVDRSDEMLGIPFELPPRILRAGEAGYGATFAEQRYFRLHQIWNAQDDDLLFTLRRGRFDIAHLAVQGAKWGVNEGAVRLTISGIAEPGIRAKDLAAALKASRVRFLVLQCYDVYQTYSSLLDLAHRIREQGGPTTALFEGKSPNLQLNFEQLYMDIVHDVPLILLFGPCPVRIAQRFSWGLVEPACCP